MRSVSSRVVCFLLVTSIAAPATSAFAQGRTVASTSPQSSRGVSTDQPSSASLRASIATAVAKSVAAEQQTGGQGATKPKTIRAQYGGGGGKGPMIMMLVGTVIGLATTVYMIKYIQKQQKDTEGGS